MDATLASQVSCSADVCPSDRLSFEAVHNKDSNSKTMSEFIRKIYLDSRSTVSGTTADYEIELPTTVAVAKNALGWITDLHLPVTFYNVDEHNDS